MIEIEYEQTLDEVLNKIDDSMRINKIYRNAMKKSLLAIKRAYSAEEFIHSQIETNVYETVCDKLKCTLNFDLETKILTLQSKLDPEFRVSVKLLSGDRYFEYLKNLQNGKEQEETYQMIDLTKNQFNLMQRVFKNALFWLDAQADTIFVLDKEGRPKIIPIAEEKLKIKEFYDFLTDRTKIVTKKIEIKYKEKLWKMLEIRKANKAHRCLICNVEIKPKKHYVHIDKQNDDGSYKNGAICENCVEKIIISKMEG